ncbi:unnamed protein product [Mesocestoides corti]|uniref:SET domain-containing protein n=1 Tax=Mesocestoides corti TaxID=53468 RepID=A0A0R3UK45_MESCO|nr:unnamed protein product [Mesocestoides corti]
MKHRLHTMQQMDSDIPACDCKDNCLNLFDCACLERPKRLNYDPTDELMLQLLPWQQDFSRSIYECKSKCSCQKTVCINRVFDVGNKGRGVRASRSLRRGEFVCWNHVYVMQTSLTIVDGAHNVTDVRTELPITSLINHSCDPNMAVMPIRVDTMQPLLALFAIKDIKQDEELTYDYCLRSGQDVVPKGKPCNCGARYCQAFLPFCV